MNMDKAQEIESLIKAADAFQPPYLVRDISVASFSIVPKKKGIKTSELIIAIINKSIEEQSAITREDINRLYWLYKTENETVPPAEERQFMPGEGWKNIVFDKESFINHWRMQRNAIGWFKAGLASAILEGKLLVLPIINI